MTQPCLLLLMTLVLTTSRCDNCDPDIPSRTLEQDIQNDMADPGSTSVEPGKCDPGHHRDRATDECKPCPAETFVTKQMSELKGYWSCETCLLPNTHLNEYTAVPCNTTRDTTILCFGGYFRDQTYPNRCDWTCKLCTECVSKSTANGHNLTTSTRGMTNAGLDGTSGNRYTTYVIFMVIFRCVFS